MLHGGRPHPDLVRTLFARRSYEIDVRAYFAASLRPDADGDADADTAPLPMPSPSPSPSSMLHGADAPHPDLVRTPAPRSYAIDVRAYSTASREENPTPSSVVGLGVEGRASQRR
jgi:hypothetical protein